MTMYVSSKPRIGPGSAIGKSAAEDAADTRGAWAGKHKAEVVAAVRDGLLTAEEAHECYGLTPEEVAVWQRTLDSLGVRGRRRRPKPEPV